MLRAYYVIAFLTIYILTHASRSVFMYRAIGKFKTRHSSTGPVPELYTIVSKLLHLARTPLVPVFVFDGPNRPIVKRGKHVKVREHWLVESFKAFADALGFYTLDVCDSHLSLCTHSTHLTL